MILWWQPITGLSPPPVTVLPRQFPTPGASGDSFSPLLGAYGDDLRHRDLPLADSCSFQNWFGHSFSLLVSLFLRLLHFFTFQAVSTA